MSFAKYAGFSLRPQLQAPGSKASSAALLQKFSGSIAIIGNSTPECRASSATRKRGS